MPRMLIVSADGGPVVVPVDEVDGIHAIDERMLDTASRPALRTEPRTPEVFCQFGGTQPALLDEEQLLSAVNRSLDMTPEQMRDASLLELFSLEAEAQTQVLSAGLLALERNPTQADQLESCMRAAHSLKGAARIVGIDSRRQCFPCDGGLSGQCPGRAIVPAARSTSMRCCRAPIC